MKEKRICITGGKGFLGRHLVQKFSKHGYKNVFAEEAYGVKSLHYTLAFEKERLYWVHSKASKNSSSWCVLLYHQVITNNVKI